MYIFSTDHRVNEVRCADHNKSGRNWMVKLVMKGNKYGLDNCLTHDEDEPMVEFYDLHYPETFGPDGQFVSRYNLSTILCEGCPLSREDLMNSSARDPEVGINLDGGVDAWSMSGPCLTEVLEVIQFLYIKHTLAPGYKTSDHYFKFVDEKLSNAN